MQLKKEKDNNSGRRGRRPLQVPKSNFGITLIALIITIIVLLILASVTLNMVMGENGIFGKANNAKNKTEVAQYEEELRMCVLELQTDAATNGTTFNMDTIKNKFVEKVKKLENTTEIEFPTTESETRLDGTYKGYEFYIDDKYAAHIGDKATGISLITSINPSGWTQGPVTATITIKSNNGINNVEPNEGSKNGNNEYIITKENITENTSFEYTVTDGQGNTQTKTAVINTIDKNPPADFTITAENTEEGLKINAETEDAEETETNACSGIDKYEYYVKKSGNIDFSNKGTENPIKNLEAGTYSVYAIAYDKAGNEKQSTNTEEVKISRIYSKVTAQMVAEHPEIYYGLTVTNYESQNRQKNWKIFYSDWKENPDNAHIFLITGECVDLSEKNRLNSSSELKNNEKKYSACWNKVPEFQKVNQSIKEQFKLSDNTLNDKVDSSKCVSTLLKPEYWETYKDIENKSDYAIGASTLEMLVESWNQRYTKNSEKIYCRPTNSNVLGYYIGLNENTTNYYISNSEMKNKEGYKNKLYYPENKSASKDNETVNAYWIAAHPGGDSTHLLFVVSNDGGIGYVGYNTSLIGVRPIVSLKKDVTVNATSLEE